MRAFAAAILLLDSSAAPTSAAWAATAPPSQLALGCRVDDEDCLAIEAPELDGECRGDGAADCGLSFRQLRSRADLARIGAAVRGNAEAAANVSASSAFIGANVPVMHLAATVGGLGIYVDLEIGTPAQVVSVMLDSGSATLGVATPSTPNTLKACDGTWESFHKGECTAGSYQPTLSTSMKIASAAKDVGCYTPVQSPINGGESCGFAVVYGDKSGIEGTILFDEVRLGPYSARVSFGAITQVTRADNGPGFQEPPANGIMGVSTWIGNCNYGTIESGVKCGGRDPPADCPERPTCRPDAFTELLKNNGLENRFGICFSRLGTPGVLSLGGADPKFYDGSMQYTKLLNFTFPEKAFFAMHMSAIGMQGKEILDTRHLTTVVDTGTTAFWLPKKMHDQMNNNSATCKVDADCMVDFQLSGHCVRLPNLMVCSLHSSRCRWNEDVVVADPGSDNLVMFGYAAMSQLYVEFNREHGLMGFAKRSAEPCRTPCDAYRLTYGCGLAEGCSWDQRGCTGTPTGGHITSAGLVSKGRCSAMGA